MAVWNAWFGAWENGCLLSYEPKKGLWIKDFWTPRPWMILIHRGKLAAGT